MMGVKEGFPCRSEHSITEADRRSKTGKKEMDERIGSERKLICLVSFEERIY